MKTDKSKQVSTETILKCWIALNTRYKEAVKKKEAVSHFWTREELLQMVHKASIEEGKTVSVKEVNKRLSQGWRYARNEVIRASFMGFWGDINSHNRDRGKLETIGEAMALSAIAQLNEAIGGKCCITSLEMKLIREKDTSNPKRWEVGKVEGWEFPSRVSKGTRSAEPSTDWLSLVGISGVDPKE